MKILIIHNRYRQAGGEDLAVELDMQLLKENGHEVSLMEFDNEALKMSKPHRFLYNSDSASAVREQIHRFRPHIVHIHNLFFEASPSIINAAKSTNTPVVMTLHNYRLVCCNALLLRNNKPCTICVNKVLPTSGIRYACYHDSRSQSALVTAITSTGKIRGTWKKVDRYIVLTDFARNLFAASSLRMPATKFEVIPNYVKSPGPKTLNRESFFLFAGRISDEKGLETALQAVAAHPAMQLKIAGSGPKEEELRERYAASKNIAFLGRKNSNELMELMQKCRALIFPSIWYEGLPYTILEAFSAGTPVIASKLGAMETMISDGVNGLHFEAGNSDSLAEAMTRIHNEQLHSQLCQGALNTYLSNYTPEAHYQSLISLYQTLSYQS